MARMVILEHTPPGADPHFDWLIQRPGEEDARPDDRRLWAFRALVRPDDPGALVLALQRADDHRVRYLDFEGELSGGRGSVRRVATGWVWRRDEAPDGLLIAGEFEGPGAAAGAWKLAPLGGARWFARRMDDPPTTP